MQKGGFPAAARPKQRQELPSLRLQMNAFEGNDGISFAGGLVCLRKVVDPDRRLHAQWPLVILLSR
jgi:hypothetical protein